MDTQQNPNEPGKSPSPGQQGGQEQDREREERERQRREREKQGGGQQGGGQARRTIRLVLLNQQAVGGNSHRFLLRPNEWLKAKSFCYARRRTN